MVNDHTNVGPLVTNLCFILMKDLWYSRLCVHNFNGNTTFSSHYCIILYPQS